MNIKISTQKPAIISFSGLVLITSMVFANQASIAAYDEHMERQLAEASIEVQIEEARKYSSGEELPSNSSIKRETNLLNRMLEEEASRTLADGARLSPSLESLQEIPNEEYRPQGFTPAKKDFDPGNIISDFVFLNKDSMTLPQIESFIKYKGKDCVEGEMPCLKDFKGKIPYTPVSDKNICSEIPELTKVSAAEMIYIVSQACGINPQVLLVTIQKEQGLVEGTKPTNYMYRAAMGHNCPDSNMSTCGSVSGGFWNQLRDGAEQKLWYGNPNSQFTYLPVGEKITRGYHPNESCGSLTFVLKNRATASLYYYTPYVPNDAALSNMAGLGNDCSSYGNRNFFRMFNEWFGDSRASE